MQSCRPDAEEHMGSGEHYTAHAQKENDIEVNYMAQMTEFWFFIKWSHTDV